MEYANTAAQNEAKLLWASATATDIDLYKNNIKKLLENIVLDPDLLSCTDALFWHALWKDSGSPSSVFLFDIRGSTRYKYHNLLRKDRRQEKQVQAMKPGTLYNCGECY